MKLTLTLLMVVLGGGSAFGQGQVWFNNRISGVVDARVMVAGIFDGFVGIAELVNVGNGQIVATTTFRNTSAAAQGYVVPVVATVPGVPAGQTVGLIMRAYSGAPSFEEAKHPPCPVLAMYGQSAVVNVVLSDPSSAPAPLIGLKDFNVVLVFCPEPSTWALGAVGLAVVLVGRRSRGVARG